MDVQAVEGELHGTPSGTEDIVMVNDVDVRYADRPEELGFGGQLGIDGLTLRLGKLLRIVEGLVFEVRRQDRCGGHNGPGQRPPTRLVDSRDDLRAGFVRFLFVPKHRAHGGLRVRDLGGRLADAIAQVVELGATDFAGAFDFDLLDEG